MRLSTWLNTCRSRQRRCGRRRYSGQRLVNGDDRPPTTERSMAMSFSPHRSLPWSRRTASSPRRTSAICPATFTQRSGGTSVPTPDRLSRFTSRLGRAAAGPELPPRAPDASNVLSQETSPRRPTLAGGELVNVSRRTSGPAAETAVPGGAPLVEEPPARARRRRAASGSASNRCAPAAFATQAETTRDSEQPLRAMPWSAPDLSTNGPSAPRGAKLTYAPLSDPAPRISQRAFHARTAVTNLAPSVNSRESDDRGAWTSGGGWRVFA